MQSVWNTDRCWHVLLMYQPLKLVGYEMSLYFALAAYRARSGSWSRDPGVKILVFISSPLVRSRNKTDYVRGNWRDIMHGVHCWKLFSIFHGRIHGSKSGGRIVASARKEAARKWGVGRAHVGSGLGGVYTPHKSFYSDFWAQNGQFWCILGANFIAIELPVLYA